MNDKPLKEADWQKAVAETNRLQRELDITNADHIALWIEANTIPDEPMSQCASWLACRIIEAHEIEMAKARLALQSRIEALEADNAKLRGALASMANSINIVGSPYHRAQEALDAIVMETKRSARKALEGSGNG